MIEHSVQCWSLKRVMASCSVFSNKYSDHLRDEELGSQWDYLGGRYYIPKLKQFPQVDPQWPATPSVSPYAYCAGNPMKYVDPDRNYMVNSQEGKQAIEFGNHVVPFMCTLMSNPASEVPMPTVVAQQRINGLGGVENLENIRNPIGPKQQHLMDGPQE